MDEVVNGHRAPSLLANAVSSCAAASPPSRADYDYGAVDGPAHFTQEVIGEGLVRLDPAA